MTPAGRRARRSWLFTPATRPDRFARAGEAGADVLIIDLEDAVAPGDKDRARAAALAHLDAGRGTAPIQALRVNGLRTRAGLDDLRLLLESRSGPDAVILPKVETPDEPRLADAWLAEAGSRAAQVALIESARGLEAAPGIARSTPRLSALMFGAADLAADLGAPAAWEPLLYARSRVVAAAAAAGIGAIDAPYFDLKDQAGLEAELRAAVALGFAAKAAIHPGQVAAINAALTPSAAAVAEAREILAQNEAGVGVVGGRMVDEAVARRARRILAAAGGAA
ncbi:MAG TPA: aldolase/citrate lyase family protein [Actinomycetota bacterium]